MSRPGAIHNVALVVWGLDRFGGMERHVTELACALRREGFEPVFLSETPLHRSNCYVRQMRRAGIEIVSAPLALWMANLARRAACRVLSWWKPAEPRDELTRLVESDLVSSWLIRALDRRLARGRMDVLHVHGCRLGQSWLLRWAQMRGVPSVYTEHVCITELGGPFDANAPVLALDASELATVSEHARRDLLSVLPEPRMVTVTGHLLGRAYAESAARPEPGLFRVLCAARLEVFKGVDVLLRAFALVGKRHPNARLVIAGDGALRSPLRHLAKEMKLGGSVEFRGHLEPARMARALAQADAVVLPSRSDSMPIAILEAMALAKPIVTTAAGGIPEMVRNGETALVVQPDNAEELAAALDLIISNAALRARLGEAARQWFYASRFNDSRVREEILGLYRRAVETRRELTRLEQVP